MGINLAQQTVIFLGSILLGAAMSLVYDIFRITRIAVNTPRGIIFAEDVIYFCIFAVVTFLFMLSGVDGKLRGFVFIGEIIGWVLCHLTLGALIIKVSRSIIAFIRKFCFFIFKWILFPIWRLFYFIVGIFVKPLAFLGRKLKSLLQKLKYRLKVNRLLLYNYFISSKKKKKSDVEGEAGGRGDET